METTTAKSLEPTIIKVTIVVKSLLLPNWVFGAAGLNGVIAVSDMENIKEQGQAPAILTSVLVTMEDMVL